MFLLSMKNDLHSIVKPRIFIWMFDTPVVRLLKYFSPLQHTTAVEKGTIWENQLRVLGLSLETLTSADHNDTKQASKDLLEKQVPNRGAAITDVLKKSHSVFICRRKLKSHIFSSKY